MLAGWFSKISGQPGKFNVQVLMANLSASQGSNCLQIAVCGQKHVKGPNTTVQELVQETHVVCWL